MAANASNGIACTLMGDSYVDRIAWIANLNRRALLATRREDRSLILTYRPEAAADVEELVQRERECCAFLSFDVIKHDGEIVLTISAPPDAGPILDDVFAPFEQGTACGCATSGKSACASPGKPRKGLALAAAGLSTLAFTCGVCCVVPFVAPATAAGVLGAALTFTAGFHELATILATIAVTFAWGATVLRRDGPVRRGELVVTIAATAMVIAALSWPHIEQWITS